MNCEMCFAEQAVRHHPYAGMVCQECWNECDAAYKEQCAKAEAAQHRVQRTAYAVSQQASFITDGNLPSKARQAERKKAAQAEIERRQKEKELFDAEVLRFVDFQKEFNLVMARNIERRKAIQAAFDEPITIYKLTFGYCAHGDEGEVLYADTDHIYVLDADSDADGYWTRHDGQKVKIWHPVSLERMVVRASQEFTLRKNVWLEEWEVDGEDNHLRPISYFPWAHSIEKIRAMIAEAGFESLPSFEWSEKLPRYSRGDVLRQAWDICPPLSDTED